MSCTENEKNSFINKKVLMAVIISLLAVLSGYVGVIPIFRSYLMNYFKISTNNFAIILSIGTITGLIGSFFGGPLIDKLGTQKIHTLALLGIVFGMFVFAFAGNSYVVFVMARGWVGVFVIPLGIATTVYLCKLFPSSERRVISLNFAATSAIGGMTFPLVAEGLISLYNNNPNIRFSNVLHIPFFIVGIVLIGGILIIRKVKQETDIEKDKDKSRSLKKIWKVPRSTFYLAIVMSLHTAADGTIYSWMATFLESKSFSLQSVRPGVVMTGFSIAYFVSRLILATLPERIGKKTFLILPGIIGGIIFISGILTRNYIFTAGGYVLGGLCWSIEYPSLVSALIGNDKRYFGTGMAIAQISSGILTFLLINFVGFIVEKLGDANMWKVMLIPALLYIGVGLCGILWVYKSKLFIKRIT